MPVLIACAAAVPADRKFTSSGISSVVSLPAGTGAAWGAADARARQRDVAEDPPRGSGKPLAFVIFKGIESYPVVSDRPVMRGDLDAIELLLQAPEGTGLRGQEKRGDVRVLSGEDRSLARCSSANCSRTRPHASPSPSRRQLRLRPAPHLLHLAARRRRAQRAQRTDDGAQGHAHARS